MPGENLSACPMRTAGAQLMFFFNMACHLPLHHLRQPHRWLFRHVCTLYYPVVDKPRLAAGPRISAFPPSTTAMSEPLSLQSMSLPFRGSASVLPFYEMSTLKLCESRTFLSFARDPSHAAKYPYDDIVI